jgi:hypothetical protein
MQKEVKSGKNKYEQIVNYFQSTMKIAHRVRFLTLREVVGGIGNGKTFFAQKTRACQLLEDP